VLSAVVANGLEVVKALAQFVLLAQDQRL